MMQTSLFLFNFPFSVFFFFFSFGSHLRLSPGHLTSYSFLPFLYSLIVVIILYFTPLVFSFWLGRSSMHRELSGSRFLFLSFPLCLFRAFCLAFWAARHAAASAASNPPMFSFFFSCHKLSIRRPSCGRIGNTSHITNRVEQEK